MVPVSTALIGVGALSPNGGREFRQRDHAQHLRPSWLGCPLRPPYWVFPFGPSAIATPLQVAARVL